MILEEVHSPSKILIFRGREKHAIERALRTCGLWAYREWPISALSYGQRKRVTIASVMVTTPDVIILDEPTAGRTGRTTRDHEFLKSLNDTGI